MDKPDLIDLRPVLHEQADILVIGGGAAGVAAAVTAARQGLNVILLERYGFCGGGAVAGMSGTICGLYAASDDLHAGPEKVVHGFVDDFIERMEAKGGLTTPVRYGKTFTRVHDPLIWREVADDLLRDAGVRVYLHTLVTDVLMQGNAYVAGVAAYTKQGKLQIRAGMTIDASGDAEVAAMAGLPTFMGQNGQVQNPTMIFRLQGVDVDRFLATYGEDSIMGPDISAQMQDLTARGEFNLPRLKIFLFPTPRPGELLCNATRIIGPDGRELNTINARDFTDAEIMGRQQAREYARFFRTHLAGCGNSFVNDTGVQVGVRQTRQIEGVAKLGSADVIAARKFKTGIARSPWPIELHSGEKPCLVWLIQDYYEVPYECFVPEQGEGLLMAGRCLSAEHEAVASARVTAQCFSYGHAIGHAAAIAIREKLAPRQINGADLREVLIRDGADLS